MLTFDQPAPRHPQGPAAPAGSAMTRLEPTLASRTAGAVLALARDLGGTARGVLDRVDLPERAYGSATAGRALAQAHQDGLSDVADVLDRLVALLEGDGDRLYQVAFAVAEADWSAVGRLGGPAIPGDRRREQP